MHMCVCVCVCVCVLCLRLLRRVVENMFNALELVKTILQSSSLRYSFVCNIIWCIVFVKEHCSSA